MKCTAAVIFLSFVLSSAFAQQHPEGPDPYLELVKRVQIALHLHGFDPGPINGVNEGRTQAALARFQLSRNLPASGATDAATLEVLGVSPDEVAQAVAGEGEENASAGAGMPLARP